jgi:hypothetical protein
MTAAGNFWANRESGASRQTKKPRVLRSENAVFMERARHQLKNIDTADCYTIFPGENVARRMVFHEQKGMSVSRQRKIPQGMRRKGTRKQW